MRKPGLHLASFVKVKGRVLKNDQSMHNNIASSERVKHWDWVRGIHGAARARKGAKKATSAFRRRNDKSLIRKALEEI